MELLGGSFTGDSGAIRCTAAQEGAVGGTKVRHHKDLCLLVKVDLAVMGADAGGILPEHQTAGGVIPPHLDGLVVQRTVMPPCWVDMERMTGLAPDWAGCSGV